MPLRTSASIGRRVSAGSTTSTGYAIARCLAVVASIPFGTSVLRSHRADLFLPESTLASVTPQNRSGHIFSDGLRSRRCIQQTAVQRGVPERRRRKRDCHTQDLRRAKTGYYAISGSYSSASNPNLGDIVTDTELGRAINDNISNKRGAYAVAVTVQQFLFSGRRRSDERLGPLWSAHQVRRQPDTAWTVVDAWRRRHRRSCAATG